MCFSLLGRSTLVASVSTVLATIALAAAPWAFWSLYLTVMHPYTRPANLVSIEEFLRYGLIPPVSLGVLSFRRADFEPGHYLMLSWEIVRYAVYGVGCYILIAAGLWRMLVTRFPKVTGRMPVGQVPVPPVAIADDNN